MRTESYQQFAIVAADTAQQLTEQLNQKLYELRFKRPVVTFEGLIARISYDESVDILEDTRDEYELEGVRLTCQDCPFFRPLLKMDGTPNRAAKRGDCQFADYGSTRRDARVCNKLFELLNRGEVRLCLAE